MVEPQSATFMCQFPDIMTAIKAGGDSWRIQLDIPKSEHKERKKLTDWMGTMLMVTVVPTKPGKTRENGPTY